MQVTRDSQTSPCCTSPHSPGAANHKGQLIVVLVRAGDLGVQRRPPHDRLVVHIVVHLQKWHSNVAFHLVVVRSAVVWACSADSRMADSWLTLVVSPRTYDWFS